METFFPACADTRNLDGGCFVFVVLDLPISFELDAPNPAEVDMLSMTELEPLTTVEFSCERIISSRLGYR